MNAMLSLRPLTLALSVILLMQTWPSAVAESLPDRQLQFLQDNCLGCHDESTQEMEINLEVSSVDWSKRESLELWERVLRAIDSEEMPPKDSGQVDPADRKAMVRWIDKRLVRHAPIGGTLARRLNQSEYEAAIRSVFGLKAFSLPAGFPVDREVHGFDNVAAGLVLSPPLLEAYTETAKQVANKIFPPKRSEPESTRQTAAAKDLVISYSCGKVVGEAFHLGMKCDPIQRSCTWPSRIEASASGTYSFTLKLSRFGAKPTDPPMIVRVFAREVSSADSVSHKNLRLLHEIEVTNESPTEFRFEADLYEGQTPVVHWANAPLDSDREDKAELRAFFERRDQEAPGYLAAWNEMVRQSNNQGFRGGIGWERVRANLEEGGLEPLSDSERESLLKKVIQNPVLYAETVVFDVFENGPALAVHGLTIEGPSRLVDGPKVLETQRLQQAFLAKGDEDPQAVIGRFLTRAFRRPVDDATVRLFAGIYEEHLGAGHSCEEALHLVIRSALVSPRFLYRCLEDGRLDDYDLATRLAYFLTGAPADDKLLSKARAGKLGNLKVLRSEAQRLIPKRANEPMVVNFTEQWLGTRKLADIMPDQRFGFSASDEASAKSEVENFFAEMLRDNRPMTDFIDPDFTWTSARVAKNVYRLDEGYDKKKKNAVHRVSLTRGGPHGGVLGQAAVLMATANGVDTQPVLRGVWVLDNIVGTPPPPPPKAVPPITPDTKGAKTPRELLAAHTSDSACASCHRKIDPIGFVMESFDPVGRWREKWPKIDTPINSSVVLADGTEIGDVVDFKRWLVEHIDQFSVCLAEKLMTYATGRLPNYSEKKEIKAIVETNREAGQGFRDLLLALVESETFRTK